MSKEDAMEDIISRITPGDYKGDRAKYADACRAAADYMRAAQPPGETEVHAALKQAVRVRNGFV